MREHGHTMYPSSPVVPHDDPTLLFANAGMNQFKPLFLGVADPQGPLAPLRRAANSQKCIRAGGKHNDLDDVGKDTYHHTFFEMLGNWSFGDYFKAEAIPLAFQLLTSVFALPKDRLYATYFGGDEAMGLPPDDEARDIWLQFLPAARVLPFDRKDNFWEMGDTGPCGPCTEIHYDRIGNGRNVADLVNRDDPNVIEIWNLVFIQYNREADKSLRPLPNKHVDTGMGFERLVSCLQDRMSNYDTDVFMPIFDAIREASGCRPYTQLLGQDDKDGVDMAYRVVGDHIRTLTVAIADGAVPSAEGRGYVLRRILRRAVRYGRQFLNAPPGFFAKLVDPVVASMKDFFPELADKRDRVVDIIAHEEATFARTLDKGTERFAAIVASLKSKGQNVVSGADAFFLYDTMGFPLDLTQRMAEEQAFTVDEQGYHAALDAARQVSRADRDARTGLVGGVRLVLEAEETAWLHNHGISVTFDEPKYTWNHEPNAVVKALFVGRSEGGFVESTDSIAAGVNFGVILDATSFYAESGGQVADQGALLDADGKSVFDVVTCQIAGGFVTHLGKATENAPSIKVGMHVRTSVDYKNRSRIAPNHTMTHVLNHALREEVGEGADQRGSIVDATKLRFDFASGKALSKGTLAKVEERCRSCISVGKEVYTKVCPLDKAMAIEGLRAVFGETYPDPVRVVSVGYPVEKLMEDPKNPAWRDASIEFCGGTHLQNTSEAKAFALVEETAVSTGVRRIFAVTGEMAAKAVQDGEALQKRVADAGMMDASLLACEVTSLTVALNESTISAVVKADLRNGIAALSKKSNDAAKQRQKNAQKASMADAAAKVADAKLRGDTMCVVQVALGCDGKAMSKLVAELLKSWPEGSIMAISFDEETLDFRVATVSKSLAADSWAGDTAALAGGKGGGKSISGSGTGKLSSREQLTKLVDFASAWKP
jgi:alanyl-tRNA synthetase